MSQVKPIFRYSGSKHRLAPWIVEQFPTHTVYVEPFSGTAAVLLSKPRSEVELLNDLNREVVNLFRVLRSPGATELMNAVQLTPWSRLEYQEAFEQVTDPVEQARRFLIRSWQGYGAMRAIPSGWLVDRTGKAKPSRSMTWRTLTARLAIVADRLQGVHIECRPALEVIAEHNLPQTLIYADPPYPLETRSEGLYTHEMTLDDHAALLTALERHSGPVALSGYDHPLYSDRLKGWEQRTKRAAACTRDDRTEHLWLKH